MAGVSGCRLGLRLLYELTVQGRQGMPIGLDRAATREDLAANLTGDRAQREPNVRPAKACSPAVLSLNEASESGLIANARVSRLFAAPSAALDHQSQSALINPFQLRVCFRTKNKSQRRGKTSKTNHFNQK